MLFLGVLYISMLFGLAYVANKLSNSLKTHFNELDETLCLQRNMDTEESIFKSVNDNCLRNKIDTDKKVLVCCTGDNKSMALLAIVSNIFGSINTNVLFINHHENNVLNMFIHDICDHNGFKFFNYNYDYEENIKKFRYNKINEICKKNDISYVFEAHTIENFCNLILHNYFSGETTFDSQSSIYNPFYNLTEEVVDRFIDKYSIPIDENMIHFTYSCLKLKNILTDINNIFGLVYPKWRQNLVRTYIKNNINEDNFINTNIIINTQCSLGNYGFIYYHDSNKTSFEMYKTIINRLCLEYNKEISSADIEGMYNNTNTCVFTEKLNTMCDEFIHKLDNINPTEFMIALINDIISDEVSDSTDASDMELVEVEDADEAVEVEDADDEDDEEEDADDEEEEDAAVEDEEEDAAVEIDEKAASVEDEEEAAKVDNEEEAAKVDNEEEAAKVDNEEVEDKSALDEPNKEKTITFPLIAVDLTQDKYIYYIVNSKDVDFNKHLLDGILHFTIVDNKFKFYI